ncbi:MAG: hypothetical protein ACTJLK_00840 [Anaplasma sp.]
MQVVLNVIERRLSKSFSVLDALGEAIIGRKEESGEPGSVSFVHHSEEFGDDIVEYTTATQHGIVCLFCHKAPWLPRS